MNAKRLLKLADHLETVPPEWFDMGHWKCDTTACAIGHACDIPEFHRAGLSMHREACAAWPIFKGKSEFGAVASFFEIDQKAAEELFGPDNGATTPKQEATLIRAFVAKESRP